MLSHDAPLLSQGGDGLWLKNLFLNLIGLLMQFNAKFTWQDPLNFNDQLSTDEKLIQKNTQDFCQKFLMPRVVDDFRHEQFDRKIMRQMGDAGLLGPKVNAVSYGLIAREIERVDSGYRSAFSIQSSLVMYAIRSFGSKEQQEKYLPKLASGELIGSFCLTEPDHGSNPAGMETRLDENFVLSGKKRWIGLAPVADIFVVWAKNPEGKIIAILVERQKGLATPEILGKLSLRTAPTGEVHFDHIKLTQDNILVKAQGIGAAFSCLNNARYSIAWGALGAAESCWYTAHDYVMRRSQFEGPLAQHQLVQYALVEMQTKIALGLQSVLRVAHLIDENKAAHEMVSLIKRNSAQLALDIARAARDLLGGNGILDEHHIMRHLVNLESVNTYEGTHNMHSLILGRAQTGIAAF